MTIGFDRHLTRARSRVLDLLPDTCQIKPYVRVIDPAGGFSETFGTPLQYNGGSNIPCRLDPTRQYRSEDLFGQEAIVNDFTLTIPFDAPIEPDHKVFIGTQQYDIRKLSEAHSWNVVKRALVTQVVTTI